MARGFEPQVDRINRSTTALYPAFVVMISVSVLALVGLTVGLQYNRKLKEALLQADKARVETEAALDEVARAKQETDHAPLSNSGILNTSRTLLGRNAT